MYVTSIMNMQGMPRITKIVVSCIEVLLDAMQASKLGKSGYLQLVPKHPYQFTGPLYVHIYRLFIV